MLKSKFALHGFSENLLYWKPINPWLREEDEILTPMDILAGDFFVTLKWKSNRESGIKVAVG